MNRRGFISGLLGLAALSVAPTLVLSETDKEKFLKEAATGRIVGKTFYLDGPVTLHNINNLVIDQCIFYCNLLPNEPLLSVNNCKNLVIQNSNFQGNESIPKKRWQI